MCKMVSNCAVDSAKENPEHAAEISNAGVLLQPIFSCIKQAVEGNAI